MVMEWEVIAGVVWGLEFASARDTHFKYFPIWSELTLANWCRHQLFSPIHPLNVCLVVCFKLFAFQLEGIRHQTSFRSPWVRAQTNFHWNFKLLQTCWDDENKGKHNNKNAHSLETQSTFSANRTVLRGIPTKTRSNPPVSVSLLSFKRTSFFDTWEL